MANTIPTAVSSLGDSFECIVLDSARVSTLSVGSTSSDTVHELGETTTLGMIYAAAAVEVIRGEAWVTANSWVLLPGYHPFNLAAGERTLRFRLPAVQSAASVVKIVEN